MLQYSRDSRYWITVPNDEKKFTKIKTKPQTKTNTNCNRERQGNFLSSSIHLSLDIQRPYHIVLLMWFLSKILEFFHWPWNVNDSPKKIYLKVVPLTSSNILLIAWFRSGLFRNKYSNMTHELIITVPVWENRPNIFCSDENPLCY